jgi:hypothetical protein
MDNIFVGIAIGIAAMSLLLAIGAWIFGSMLSGRWVPPGKEMVATFFWWITGPWVLLKVMFKGQRVTRRMILLGLNFALGVFLMLLGVPLWIIICIMAFVEIERQFAFLDKHR